MCLSDIIRLAYNIKPYQLRSPKWTGTERFDIEAIVPQATTKPEFRVMLQGMLTERFKLKVLYETRAAVVYELITDKSGAKLKAATGPSTSLNGEKDTPYRGSYTIIESDRAVIQAVNEPISFLTAQLSDLFDMPVPTPSMQSHLRRVLTV
jgi:uncharacterized protein (TIGR03435 family)